MNTAHAADRPARYVGRFAPSPTGPLHAGSLVAALASWLDARAHGGRWLVRIEDVDRPRCVPGAAETILRQLAACGLVPDETPLWQSTRDDAYDRALAHLSGAGWAYPCACSRQDIELELTRRGRTRERHAELVYPGTCRAGLRGRIARATRVLTLPALLDSVQPDERNPLVITWHDRRLGALTQDVSAEVGDFVLQRADGLWAYQLAVIVDDAEQGITDVVRGEDLADNTPRQIHLQRLLGLPTPRYLHTPLVLGIDGAKLSKQNGAVALMLDSTHDALARLQEAAAVLGLGDAGTPGPLGDWLHGAVDRWRAVGPRGDGMIAGSSSSRTGDTP
ncbi:MAG TPA: tRNA glutamyl-Q(34) synthetase GluQRS [Burkholderiaceae bacterium]|nr:tRNA glutamyl-Q(34) synthetase GluQRS [Burkholderiaceae bacterium]